MMPILSPCRNLYYEVVGTHHSATTAMPEDKNPKRKRSAVLRVLGIGGGAGFVFVTLAVILVIIWAVEP